MAQDRCVRERNHADFLSALEGETLRHRQARAKDLMGRAHVRKWTLRKLGMSEEYVKVSLRWYEQRAHGQLTKFEKVADCGQTSIRVICQCCGVVVDRQTQCRLKLLCLRCRSARAYEERARFMSAHSVALNKAKRSGLLNPSRPRGQWTEKFITLTGPHLASDTVELRIDRIAAAWPEFLRRLNRWLRKKRASESSHWFRVLEWTPGESDSLGHPHFHVWFFGPYVPVDEIRGWWRESLESLGLVFGETNPIVHIERCYNQDGAAHELIKYLTKDIDANGDKISPQVYAAVYRSFDGRRMLQASKGFMKLAKDGYHPCQACGETLAKRIEILKREIPVHGPEVDSSTPSGGR